MTDRAGRVLAVVSYFRDGSVYPRSGPPERQDDTYWSNIAANAATFRHVAGADHEFLVCAGNEPPSDAATVLRRSGAEIRSVPFSRRPDDGFYDRYLGSLYLLDVATSLADEADDDDVLLFVDPDVVWVRSIDPLLAEIARGGVVAYDLAVPEDVPLCGLTRREQTDMLEAATGATATQPITHFGGEFYGMTGAVLRQVADQIEPLWDEALRRHRSGEPHHNNEEHFLNAALWHLGEQSGRANDHLQRIRTLPKPFGTRERAGRPLVAWHLPNEKDSGLLRVFRHVSSGRSLPPVGDAYVRWLARTTGVEASGRRWVGDRARQLKWIATGSYRTGTTNHGL